MTTQEVKKMIQKKFASSTAQTSEIIKYVLSEDGSVPPATVSWVTSPTKTPSTAPS